MNADLLARGYSAFLNFLAEPALRSLLLGCVAALALAAFRVQRVRARLLVWTAVLCAALAMPLLGAFLPRVRVGVPAGWMKSLQTSFQASFQGSPGRAAQHETAASGAVVRSAETAARASSKAFVASGNAVDRSLRREMKIDAGGKAARAKTSEAQVLSAASSREPRRSDTKDAITPVVTTPAAAPSAAPVKSFAIPWTALMLAVYLLGAGILLTRVAIGVWFSARLGRSAQDIEDREALRVLRYRAAFTGLTNVPRLKESAVAAVPATVGVRRAVILLPTTWRTWTDEQLDAILAHEVSHVARRDALTQMLSLIHRAIFWFSPLGWWLDRQLTDLAEQASDEAALAGGADRQRYAKTLVGFFEQLGAAPGRVWWQGVSMAKASKIGSAERRVGRILAWRGGMSMKKSFAVALLTIAAPIIFVAASVHPFIARAKDKPPAPPQNVMQPGGPVAPVLPNAPKGGVVAPAIAAAPAAAPLLPNAPSGGVVANAPIDTPLIAGPTTPANLSTPPAAAPMLPEAPTGPRTRVPTQTPLGASTPRAEIGAGALAAVAPVAGYEPSTPMAAVAPMPGFAPSTPMAATAPLAPRAPIAPAQNQSGNTVINGSYSYGGGQRYVIMSGKDEGIEMSGDDEDVEHARRLREKLGTDLIWFERDEKSYVITDPAFIAKAKALFAPEDALSKQQDELSRQQDALSKQQDALSNQQDNVKVKVPDISPDIKRIQNELDALRQSGATQSELGRLQSELGQLQSRMGGFQSEAGAKQSEIGQQQGELGRQQGELGRKQGELGRQQGEIARKASMELRHMFDEAIANGTAKPE